LRLVLIFILLRFNHIIHFSGGNGGNAGFNTEYTVRAYGGSLYDTTLASLELRPGSGGGGASGDGGSSGGKGGAGGAAIRLFAETITINGSILTNGENGESCSNSGSTW